MMTDEHDALDQVEELFDFLQGTVPAGYSLRDDAVPHLTADQAWTAVWYLQNLYWQVPDHIERCNVCGRLFDSHSEGDCLDYGEKPYLFCDECMCTKEYEHKQAAAKELPNR